DGQACSARRLQRADAHLIGSREASRRDPEVPRHGLPPDLPPQRRAKPGALHRGLRARRVAEAPPMTVRFGCQLWSQATTWPEFRDAALAAEAAGWDSVWTWVHLFAIFGPWDQPIFEGWSVLMALGPLTSRVRLGLMVGANTFRNPGITAKLATT